MFKFSEQGDNLSASTNILKFGDTENRINFVNFIEPPYTSRK